MRPGDLVRIVPFDTDHTGRHALGTVAVGPGRRADDGDDVRAAVRLLKIPPDAAPAMFLGEDPEARALPLAHGHMAQVLLMGQIVNVPALHLEPAK